MNPYVWAQLRHRPRRAITVAAAVCLGAALFVALDALGAGVRAAARAPLEAVAADLIVTRPVSDVDSAGQVGRGVRMPFGLAPFAAGDVAAVAATDGVAAAAGSLALWEFGPRSTVTIVGLDPAQTAVGPGRIVTEELKAGRAFRADESDAAVVDEHYAQFYGIRVGGDVTVAGRRFTVVGLVTLPDASQAAAANIYLPIGVARALAQVPDGQVNEVHVRVRDARDTDAVVSRIESTVGDVSAVTTDSLVQVFGAIGRISARFSTVAGVVALLASVVLAGLALHGLVAERRREIGLLRAIGWRRRDVVRSFGVEAAVVATAGGLVGVLLGVGLALLLSLVPAPAPEAEHAGQHGALPTTAPSQSLPTVVSLGGVAAGFFVAVGGGVLAGLVAARRAAAVRPARSLGSI